jgi:molecular chaperone IbpA
MTRLVPASIFNELRNDPFLVGFDQIFDRLLSTGAGSVQTPSYPPYNIVKVNDDEFRIELAVAGFKEEELSVTVLDDKLTIESNKDHSASGGHEKLLHQGIAERNFKRTWTLSPTVQVTGALFEDGFLSVFLRNEIEEAKPQKIKIENYTLSGEDRKKLWRARKPQVLNE